MFLLFCIFYLLVIRILYFNPKIPLHKIILWPLYGIYIMIDYGVSLCQLIKKEKRT